MALFIIILAGWGINALVRVAQRSRAQRIAAQKQRALEIQREQEAQRRADAARLREEWRERERQAREEYLQRRRAEREAERLAEEQKRQAEQFARDAQKARKAEFEREQAEADLDHYEALRLGYIALCDTLEAELYDIATTAKRRAAIQRQLLNLDQKLRAIDSKRAKAYFVLREEAC